MATKKPVLVQTTFLDALPVSTPVIDKPIKAPPKTPKETPPTTTVPKEEKEEIVPATIAVIPSKTQCWLCKGKDLKEMTTDKGQTFMMCKCGASQ